MTAKTAKAAKTEKEQTLLIIKPDAVRDNLQADILSHLEAHGLKPVFTQAVIPSRDILNRHYDFDDAWRRKVGESALKTCRQENDDPVAMYGSDDPVDIGEAVRQRLVDFMASGEVLAMVLEGEDVVLRVRELTGATQPADAAPETLRGKFGADTFLQAHREKRSLENIVHSSETPEEAHRELSLWFPKLSA